jgi:Ca2+/H+ antiporter
VLVTTAVAAMAITMLVNDDPHAASAQVVLFAVSELVVIGYVVLLYRPLTTRTCIRCRPDRDSDVRRCAMPHVGPERP